MKPCAYVVALGMSSSTVGDCAAEWLLHSATATTTQGTARRFMACPY
jgi:hypothetical protein